MQPNLEFEWGSGNLTHFYSRPFYSINLYIYFIYRELSPSSLDSVPRDLCPSVLIVLIYRYILILWFLVPSPKRTGCFSLSSQLMHQPFLSCISCILSFPPHILQGQQAWEIKHFLKIFEFLYFHSLLSQLKRVHKNYK